MVARAHREVLSLAGGWVIVESVERWWSQTNTEESDELYENMKQCCKL